MCSMRGVEGPRISFNLISCECSMQTMEPRTFIVHGKSMDVSCVVHMLALKKRKEAISF